MKYDWRRFVNVAEKECVKGLKWVKGGEAEKYTQPFYKHFGNEQRFPWCGAFVLWCLRESGCEFPISPMKGQTFALVQIWKNFAQKEGLLLDNKTDLLPGDILLFDWNNNGTVEHMGIFTRNFYDTHDYPSGKRLVKMAISLEGNTSHDQWKDGMTAIKKRNLSTIDSVIRLPREYAFSSDMQLET